MHYRRPMPYGFTLIELLVVIAIVSIVAALLFPVFAKVREKGRQAVCASNLKQIGLAWQLYTQDYDDQNVIGGYFSSDFNYFYAWFGTVLPDGHLDPSKGFISPYTAANFVIHDCPSANLLSITLPGPGANVGYAVNEALYPNNNSGDSSLSVQTVNLNKVTNPADTILMADGATYQFFGKPFLFSTMYLYMPSNQASPSNPSGYGFPTAHGLHLRRANVLWFDGHLKAELVTPPTQPDIFGNAPSAVSAEPWNIGYIQKPSCAGDASCQDYYYQVAKR